MCVCVHRKRHKIHCGIFRDLDAVFINLEKKSGVMKGNDERTDRIFSKGNKRLREAERSLGHEKVTVT